MTVEVNTKQKPFRNHCKCLFAFLVVPRHPSSNPNPNTQGQAQLWVSEAIDTFVSLNDWLKGKKPTRKSLFTVEMRRRGFISDPREA
jgi:hypothetical protein